MIAVPGRKNLVSVREWSFALFALWCGRCKHMKRKDGHWKHRAPGGLKLQRYRFTIVIKLRVIQNQRIEWNIHLKEGHSRSRGRSEVMVMRLSRRRLSAYLIGLNRFNNSCFPQCSSKKLFESYIKSNHLSCWD